MASDVLVIGAGPAGLAVAGALSHRGVACDVIEQSAKVGTSWRNHYERLHLHTPRNHSGLPHLPMPAEYPTYPSREQVVAYLESYAVKHRVQPRFGVTVTKVMREGERWSVASSEGRLSARHLVMCTGYNRVPIEPSWPGLETFGGQILHSSKYKTGAAFAGKRVLVVGAGNSGAEIALDLAEQGAKPSLCIRGPINIVARDVGPIPALNIGIALEWTPVWFRNAVLRRSSRALFGDLRPWGITWSDTGVLTQIMNGRIPLIDVGTIAAIKDGRITVVPGIERFDASGVRCVDGKQHELDAVVLATGFRTGLEAMFEGQGVELSERGLPKHLTGSAAAPNLYFVGFENPSTGFLRAIGLRAREVAALIQRG